MDAKLREKAEWITTRVKRISSVSPERPREFVTGETCLYLGRQYRLRVSPGAPRSLMLSRGWLEVAHPPDLESDERASYIRAALTDWYIARARERLPKLAATWAKRFGEPFERVMVASQAKRWGSCAGGSLRFNWRIVQAPRALVDYVVAHEVVHLRHPDHSAAFWSDLGRLLPDYEARRERLRTMGRELEW
jgi:predicted metal-dependent hydrolase